MAVKALNKNFEKLREYEQNGNESVGGGQRAREMHVSRAPLSGLYSKMFLLTVFVIPRVPGLWDPGNERVGGEEKVVGCVCESLLLLASKLKGGRKSGKKIGGKEKKEEPGQDQRKGPLVAGVGGEAPCPSGVRKGVRSWECSAALQKFPETG